MTRGEFLLQRLKDECSMYRVISIVCFVAAAASIALMVAVVATGKPEGLIPFAGMFLFFITYGLTGKKQSEGLAAVIDEVGDDPKAIVERHDLSKSTVLTIVNMQRPVKEYLQQFIAYGSCALMMLVLGILLIVFTQEYGEPVFWGFSALILLGALWLGVLAFQAIRNWRAAKQLEAISEY